MVCQAGPVLSGISTIFDGDSMICAHFPGEGTGFRVWLALET